MTVKNKTNKNYKRSQRGRSMVEMLGVLAIVGVLSAGGVYGYGVAMKKHKANELLHQASMQASSIAAQIASGKTDLALENFGNSSNGSFSSVKGPDGSSNYQSGDDKFTMQITGMDSAVCEQMQGMKGGTVRSVSCSAPDANGKVTATLAFNKDLSSTPVASDYNKDTTGKECTDGGFQWCGDSCKTDCCNGTCDENAVCLPAGYCQCKEGYYGNGTTCAPDNGADSAEDCKALDGYYGWNGTQCVDCDGWVGTGTGGSIETACECYNKKPDGSCCSFYSAWNGEKCVDCMNNGAGGGVFGVGGSVETACVCEYSGKRDDGSCCLDGQGWDGTRCIDCDAGGIGTGGSLETACACEGARKTDGSCCPYEHGWNGTECIYCGAGYVGTGGSPETACDCASIPTGTTSDGTCCEGSFMGWNGTQCVDCGPYLGTGGSIETACACEGARKTDGSCCEYGHGWNGTECIYCGGGYVGTGGSPETACDCEYSGKQTDGSCCEYGGYGWNGTECVDCGAGGIGEGGSPATACNCDAGRNADGSCQ